MELNRDHRHCLVERLKEALQKKELNDAVAADRSKKKEEANTRRAEELKAIPKEDETIREQVKKRHEEEIQREDHLNEWIDIDEFLLQETIKTIENALIEGEIEF